MLGILFIRCNMFAGFVCGDLEIVEVLSIFVHLYIVYLSIIVNCVCCQLVFCILDFSADVASRVGGR